MKEEIIKSGIVRRIIERVENENGLFISPETTDIILTAFLDTVEDILSEGDSIKLKGYMTIYPQLYKSRQITIFKSCIGRNLVLIRLQKMKYLCVYLTINLHGLLIMVG